MVKAGFVTIVGTPNSGKSTFLNRVLNDKLSIVSSKPQTTRKQIKGFFTEGNKQIVFVDTPGFHKSDKLFNKLMVEEILESLEGIDLVIFITDISKKIDEDENILLGILKEVKIPKICLLNKKDLGINKEKYELINSKKTIFDKILLISTLNGEDVKNVVENIYVYLKNVEQFYYPEDIISDITDREQAEEIIREEVFYFTKNEIPYSTYIEIIQFLEDEQLIEIDANIVVEKNSQKPILIGKNGQMIKKIRLASQKELKRIFEKKVKLNLFVKVEKNWTKDINHLSNLGFSKTVINKYRKQKTKIKKYNNKKKKNKF